jgi:arabinose-5-phosphate isomerase
MSMAHDLQQTAIGDLMTTDGKTIQASALAAEAVKMLQQYKIQGLLVVDDESRLQGVLNFNDLLQAGVV